MAAQARQKEGSKWHPYLRMLPSLEEYRAKIPQYAEAPLLADFAELPVMQRNTYFTTGALLDNDPHLLQTCIEALQSEGWPELQELSLPDVALAARHFQDRAHGDEQNKGWMLPVLDLLNTAEAERINTQRKFFNGQLQVRTSMFVPKGHELFNTYYPLPNLHLVGFYGLFLDSNSHPWGSKGMMSKMLVHDLGLPNVDCYARVGRNGTRSSLKEVTDAALERRWEPHMVAPRCREEVLSTNQGPARCSLARLAWELCGDTWYPKTQTLRSKTNALIAERRSRERQELYELQLKAEALNGSSRSMESHADRAEDVQRKPNQTLEHIGQCGAGSNDADCKSILDMPLGDSNGGDSLIERR
eukprot:gnl/TRDRNA2_/TRDRNA2_177207_c2_seq36.p1 gnl/TRDRNA2_/TRDRNA2_177207_c2~~gnl/TRDRNA2_/TRDRNA2_177207_c2_seq36.p1  ORF type:complete len:359 (+),score=26.17 gnl/TRDRNA2_/TRDRNA2_177207_c2_seq36:418-1494(+)